jgi:hypothetical protein
MLVVFATLACTDSTSPSAFSSSASLSRSEGRGLFQRYVALGSGMSMGWQSDGVTAESQSDSWPAQLARIAHRELDQPYLASPSCLPPQAPPFVTFNWAVAGPCANAPGVTLPTQNLAIKGATVSSALLATVGAAVGDSGFGFPRVMPLVLPAGVTQVGAVAGLKPKIVSVEYGTSEIVRSLASPGSPRLIPSATAWSALYDQILDEVSKSADVVVLTLPPRVPPPGFVDVSILMQAFTRSPELLAQFNVTLPPWPCEVLSRLIYVPQYVRFLAAHAQGEGPVPLVCADLFRSDFSINYDTYLELRSAVEAMRAHIRSEADRRGFAYFDLEPLYTSSPSFDLARFLSSTEPFGAYVSLDGIYPTAAGNALLAEAAARALNERYDLGLQVSAPAASLAR